MTARTKHTAPQPALPLDIAACKQARMSRDPRFDGQFYVAVLSTGVFCRPICPARMPAEENVRYYPSAAAAQDAGYRPCLRCRPETARRLPEWHIGSETVIRALRMIDGGYLNDRSVADLAGTLGLSERQLRRLFQSHLGTSPLSAARMQRLQLARKLLDETTLPVVDVAMHAGFGSVRRFNAEVKRVYGRTPSALRRKSGSRVISTVKLELPVRLPYSKAWVMNFLELRALEGLEEVRDGVYHRAVPVTGGGIEWLTVSVEEDHVCVQVPVNTLEPLSHVVRRVRRVFDLDADAQVIDAHLLQDPYLEKWTRQIPGIRVPGAWDGFETAVRAILGQQVSVARARDLAAAMMQRYGEGQFPSPSQLLKADVAELGMPGRRGEAVRQLAAAVMSGSLVLDDDQDSEALSAALCELPGIGPWTAGYISMRVVKNPDAFLPSDWVVLKVLDCKPKAANQRAEPWRPWRAYALMTLWFAAGVQRQEKRGKK